jgi:uncharacterized protein YehS (DUF1456 family)
VKTRHGHARREPASAAEKINNSIHLKILVFAEKPGSDDILERLTETDMPLVNVNIV